MPYIINNNWIAGNAPKISRAKRWGHWFVQDETAGSCRNVAMLQSQMAEMLSTMDSLQPLNPPWQPSSSTAPWVASQLMVSGIMFCKIRRHVRMLHPRRTQVAVFVMIVGAVLYLNGVVDAELGDMHSEVKKRRPLGLTVYLSSNEPTQMEGFRSMICGVVFFLTLWRLSLTGRVRHFVKQLDLDGFSSMFRPCRRSASMAIVTVCALVWAEILDAELGDMHSERHKRSPIGLTIYFSLVDHQHSTIWVPAYFSALAMAVNLIVYREKMRTRMHVTASILCLFLFTTVFPQFWSTETAKPGALRQ